MYVLSYLCAFSSWKPEIMSSLFVPHLPGSSTVPCTNQVLNISWLNRNKMNSTLIIFIFKIGNNSFKGSDIIFEYIFCICFQWVDINFLRKIQLHVLVTLGWGAGPTGKKWPLYRLAPIMFPEKGLPLLTFPFFPSLPLWLPKVGWKNHLSLLTYPYLPECRGWYGFQQERNKIMFNPTTGCKQSKPIPIDFLAKRDWEPLLHSH